MADSNIYQGLYVVWDQAQVWWAVVSPHLKSNIAIHIYFVSAGAITFGNSLLIAYAAKDRLRDLKLEAFDISFRGR